MEYYEEKRQTDRQEQQKEQMTATCTALASQDNVEGKKPDTKRMHVV